MRNVYVSLIVGLILCLNGCTPKEEAPQGKPVVLTQSEIDAAPSKELTKEWYAWHTKGLKLKKSRQNEEALYCFHQAVKAWPKKIDDDKKAEYERFGKHKPEPTDTLLQIGLVYLELEQPKWAIYYFDKFDHYLPYNNLTGSKRKLAERMLDGQ